MSMRSPFWLSVIVTASGAMRQPTLVTRASTRASSPGSTRTLPSFVRRWTESSALTEYVSLVRTHAGVAGFQESRGTSPRCGTASLPLATS